MDKTGHLVRLSMSRDRQSPSNYNMNSNQKCLNTETGHINSKPLGELRVKYRFSVPTLGDSDFDT